MMISLTYLQTLGISMIVLALIILFAMAHLKIKERMSKK